MSELPLWVALVLSAVFLAFGGGLFYLARDTEPPGRRFLWARAAMWTAFGVGLLVGYWSEGIGGAFLVAAILGRLVLLFIPWRLPTTDPTPGSPPGPR